MTFYTPNAITHLVVHTNLVGLRIILGQQQADRLLRPLPFSSRSTTDAEFKYSHTERETLVILRGCHHFHHYVFDRHIIINIDHKTLERLLSHNSNPPPRVQTWIIHLQAYNCTIKYISGTNNPAAFLSRNKSKNI